MSRPPGVPPQYWHPLDPPGPHLAMPTLSRLVARGGLPEEWAKESLRQAAAATCRPGASLSGLQMRLMHHLHARVMVWHMRRREVTHIIMDALRAGDWERADTADTRHALTRWERFHLMSQAAPRRDPTFVPCAGVRRWRV